jgi:glycosyltransferase involved in cell wall biosynthesis
MKDSKELPMLSCKTLTYGRVKFLEEAIQSFLQQNYEGPSEMVIVNDYPKQILEYNHPQIRIFNLHQTFSTIGEKENFATEQCKGDIILQFDDDDIALPNHLQNVNKFFTENTDLIHWHRGIYMDMPIMREITGVGNSGIVYSRRIWKELGGYRLENAGHDMSFVTAIHHASKNVIFAAPVDEEVSWVYRWGGMGYHLSGQGTDTPDRPNIIQRHGEYIESLRLAGKIPIGIVKLHPHWMYDYSIMAKKLCQKK